MALIADTNAVYALYDSDDTDHRAACAEMEKSHDIVRIPGPLIAEIAYLLRARLGQDAVLAFLDDILDGSFTIEELTIDNWIHARNLLERYHSLDIGLPDACVASLAERYSGSSIFTFDRRDFGALRRSNGEPFALVP